MRILLLLLTMLQDGTIDFPEPPAPSPVVQMTRSHSRAWTRSPLTSYT